MNKVFLIYFCLNLFSCNERDLLSGSWENKHGETIEFQDSYFIVSNSKGHKYFFEYFTKVDTISFTFQNCDNFKANSLFSFNNNALSFKTIHEDTFIFNKTLNFILNDSVFHRNDTNEKSDLYSLNANKSVKFNPKLNGTYLNELNDDTLIIYTENRVSKIHFPLIQMDEDIHSEYSILKIMKPNEIFTDNNQVIFFNSCEFSQEFIESIKGIHYEFLLMVLNMKLNKKIFIEKNDENTLIFNYDNAKYKYIKIN